MQQAQQAAWHKGACHCGAVKFEVRTAITPAARCNCSLCRRKGALMSPMFDGHALRILAGRDALTVYQFNTRVAKHYFCKHCGIYPFHQTRKDPACWRVNLGCLDDVDAYALDATVSDGASLSVVEDA
ncbi:type I-B CRISPR-associated protein Cas8b1/Cst1 [Burkholderia ubonensis]|uniref:GFA family protein n=1 Tax=Burkholderia ubonensis TaxID=101571 RepID=UPI000757902A|nr:GFA family protein [Burkholderia ubonensis]KVC93400.1 type I-B CRISPR-associated protein Cas8b1/Cst1 [Burkholderia ubonensis]KVD20084.1 type I-B CRISPR-associated protein Cas8b1/Cst1 [Burkholderia ubonensis]KVD65776.1 type I-B CRISPR-associated protein Cas8b1/Cst1 [Burkholderia ubonensis]KVO87350.1 type I-B CRISPR-associated protein Cas8b1/Cst1 [Burkholderia ubonensis]KVQ03258.1 type I-B CRISPR-associated protein Cas8b1/Cst1 [Burkholderia ubonensis]